MTKWSVPPSSWRRWLTVADRAGCVEARSGGPLGWRCRAIAETLTDRLCCGRFLALSLAAIVWLSLAACDKRDDTKPIPRDRDAPTVVVVESPKALAQVAESEPNDEPEAATALPFEAAGTGALDGEDDVDVYRVEVAEAGILSARLSGVEDVDLILTLNDEAGETLARSDRGPARVEEGIANFAIAPGVYYLAVSEFVSKRRKKAGEPRVGPSGSYELTATWVAPDVAGEASGAEEVEPNDDVDGARELFLGDQVSGYIGWANDVDLWKISIEGFTDRYSLDLEVSEVSGVALTLEVLDAGGKPVVARSGKRERPLAVRNLVPRAHDSGTEPAQRFFYVRLSARRSNPTEPYRLQVATRLLEPDEEVEPNDSPEQAGPLLPEAGAEGALPAASARIRRGYLPFGDQDFYRLDADQRPRLLTVEVAPKGELAPKVSVLVAGATVAMAEAVQAGSSAYLADVEIAAGQAPVVLVSGAGAPADQASYELTWSLADKPAEAASDVFEDGLPSPDGVDDGP